MTFTSLDPQEPILSAESLSPDAALEVERVDAVEGGTRATIIVKPRAGHEGLLIVPATLSMATKSQEVLIFGTVRPAPAASGAAASPAAASPAPAGAAAPPSAPATPSGATP